MQNRAIVGGNCVCLHTKQSYYRVGVAFSFYVAKENAFPSESKCFAKVIFHWTLTYIISLVQCLLFAKGRVECKRWSLSHLRSRKGQHSHSAPDSLKTEIFHRPTCQEWPPWSTKSLWKILDSIPVKGMGRRQILNSVTWENFPSQLKHRLMKSHFSGIRSLICWFCLVEVLHLDRFENGSIVTIYFIFSLSPWIF